MSESKLALSDCTKADLLWIIKQITCFQSDKYYLASALSDLQYKKEMEQLSKADKIAKEADAKRKQCFDLMIPYDGKKLLDVPSEVLNKAGKLMKEAQVLDSKWNKLMKIGSDR